MWQVGPPVQHDKEVPNATVFLPYQSQKARTVDRGRRVAQEAKCSNPDPIYQCESLTCRAHSRATAGDRVFRNFSEFHRLAAGAAQTR